MILWMKWFLTKFGLARIYDKQRRNGFELTDKRREIHEKFLVANRKQQKEIEAVCRAWLEAIDWFSCKENKNGTI